MMPPDFANSPVWKIGFIPEILIGEITGLISPQTLSCVEESSILG
jgi:hypothetical protein